MGLISRVSSRTYRDFSMSENGNVQVRIMEVPETPTSTVHDATRLTEDINDNESARLLVDAIGSPSSTSFSEQDRASTSYGTSPIGTVSPDAQALNTTNEFDSV